MQATYDNEDKTYITKKNTTSPDAAAPAAARLAVSHDEGMATDHDGLVVASEVAKKACNLCPRACNCDRTDHLGFCGMPNKLVVATAFPHMWEEPVISGVKGSGTIFFSGCTMRCCFCQNHEISAEHKGKVLKSRELAEVMLRLQAQGCHNISLITADHFIDLLPEVIELAKKEGLVVPIAFNTSSYIRAESLKKLEGLIDIYLPDLKYMSDEPAVKYSKAPHYFAFATEAIAEMYRQVGVFSIDEHGIMQHGLIVRHLALPGLLQDSKNIISYLHKTYGDKILISLMNQYTPFYQAAKYPEINQPLDPADYEELWDFAEDIGISNGFAQAPVSDDEAFYVPCFSGAELSFAPDYKPPPKL